MISVEDVSKKYRLTARGLNSALLRETFMNAVSRLTARKRLAEKKEFFALKNISLEVKKGETVAIVGRNGSGKSTLLKILARITHPSSGQISLYGRTGSLLEVGAGFQQELTGRENIFLNGAILGMSHREIRGKYDEIIDFAGIENFLDTQVKYYSSGMFMRLAFSIAAHVEPEILLLDEVLAVGDFEFQEKCVKKIEALGTRGITTLIVSHDLPKVERLCRRSVWLEKGILKMDGATETVICAFSDSVPETPDQAPAE